MKDISTWQEFEEHVCSLFDSTGHETRFRVVFETPGLEQAKSEIDVVAESHRHVLCIDAKLYGASRRRRAALRRQAKKHAARVREYQNTVDKRCIPLLVTFWDDDLLTEEDCFVVPLEKLNDFVLNTDTYIEESLT